MDRESLINLTALLVTSFFTIRCQSGEAFDFNRKVGAAFEILPFPHKLTFFAYSIN